MELANELQAFGCGDLNVEGILLHHQNFMKKFDRIRRLTGCRILSLSNMTVSQGFFTHLTKRVFEKTKEEVLNLSLATGFS